MLLGSPIETGGRAIVTSSSSSEKQLGNETNRNEMAPEGSPTSWTDPNYVATVVGVLSIGALCVYSATTRSGLTPEEVTVVVLAVSLPAAIAHWIARRWG